MTTLIVPSSYASIVFSRSKVSVNLNAGGTGTIKDHTAEVDRVIDARITKALMLMGEVVEGHAKTDCPVDTGNLRNSITHAVIDDAGYVGTNVEYAPYVEFLDRFHHPVGKAHFLRDGATTHIPELKAVAQTTLATG
jgi:hypothetical protein